MIYMQVLVIEIETHAPRSATRCRDHFHLALEYSSTHAVIRVDFKHVYNNYNQAHDRPENTFRFSYLVWRAFQFISRSSGGIPNLNSDCDSVTTTVDTLYHLVMVYARYGWFRDYMRWPRSSGNLEVNEQSRVRIPSTVPKPIVLVILPGTYSIINTRYMYFTRRISTTCKM
jgi:hypothetical protein